VQNRTDTTTPAPDHHQGAHHPVKIRKNRYWDKTINTFAFFSEAANIGIVIQMISKWWPPLMTIGRGVFSSFVAIADPAIYFFKSLIRLTKIVGRAYFDVKFEEEKNGTHKWQTQADIASLSFFTLAIPMFLGLIITGPVGITVAWALALTGLSVVGYFDYFHQEKLALDTYNQKLQKFSDDIADDKKSSSSRELQHAYRDYVAARNSKWLFVGLLVGLALLLLCGSAAVFAPPALVPLLFITSKVASGFLAFIACARFANWRWSKKNNAASSESLISLSPTNDKEHTTATTAKISAGLGLSLAPHADQVSTQDNIPPNNSTNPIRIPQPELEDHNWLPPRRSKP